MGGENKKIIGGIVANEPELNQLFQEVLSGIRDDINEAQQNVEMYLDAILNATGGKDVYGQLYNDALKIKGQARDKQLKFIDMFKDRVTKKEIINSNVKKESETPFDHSELNKVLDELEQGKKYENQKPIISSSPSNVKSLQINEKILEIDEDIYDEDVDIDFDEDEN